MFKSREQRAYEAELDALSKEKAALKAQAAALAEEREPKQNDYRACSKRFVRIQPLQGYWLGWKVAQDTRGSARLDLVRPRFAAVDPGNLLRTAARVTPSGSVPSSDWRQGRRDPYEQPPPLLGFGQGARIKVMRHLDFGVPPRFSRQRRALDQRGAELHGRDLAKRGFLGARDPADDGYPVVHREPDFGAAVSSIGDALKENFKPPEKPWFDFGAGVNLELDEGSLQPTVRLKVKDFFSIKLLPEPMFKVQKRIRFGPSTLGVRVNYELPLAEARNLWAPPARLMLRLDNHMGGLRLGPGGADFDEQLLQLGKSTALRAALSVDFPRTLPLEEGEKLFGWRARRLGVKTRW